MKLTYFLRVITGKTGGKTGGKTDPAAAKAQKSTSAKAGLQVRLITLPSTPQTR